MNVEVRESNIAGAGRGLVALQDFDAGSIVLRLDRPYVAELNVERMQDTCAWCFQRGALDPVERAASAKLHLPTGFVETKACAGCRKVRYCSQACQRKAWKREHKHECKALKPDSRPDLPPGVRAVIKLLGRVQADPEGKDEELLEMLKFRPYSDPETLQGFSQRNPATMEQYETMAYAAWKYAGEPMLGNMESLPIAKGFFFSFVFNALGLASPYNDDHFGSAFDPLLCSANHSCDPNVAHLFNQPESILRAVKPIKKGDEIFIRYIDVTNPYGVRKGELFKRYHFDCKCTKCVLGPTTPTEAFLRDASMLDARIATVADGLITRHFNNLPQHILPGGDAVAMKRLAAIEAEAFSVSGISQERASQSEQASEPEIKDALRLCLNSGMWSFKRQPVPHLLRQLYKYYLETRQRYAAWRVGIQMYFESGSAANDQSLQPGRLIDVWSLATITNSLCYPEMAEVRREMTEVGLDPMIVFTGLLLETHAEMPRAYGMKSPFGSIVETVYNQVLAKLPFPLEQLREMIKEAWPKLEAVAKTVDVLNL